MTLPVNEPRAGARARRNAAAHTGDSLYFIDPNGGSLFLNNAGFLEIRLDTDPLLTVGTGGLRVDTDELYRRHQVWN